MIYILDACALIAYLRDEPGAEVVESFLIESDHLCMVHAVNLCEVYYEFLRAGDARSARAAMAELQSAGLVFREDMDLAFWQEAGRYKATSRRVSLADCFALALASRERGVILTSDHHEFDAIAERGICPVEFIR